MSNHIFIAIPAYTGQMHMATFRSLMHDFMAFKERGDEVEVFDEVGNAMIGDARAIICQHFLESAATHLIFIDSDIGWEKGALLKLVDHGEDFVGGAYPYRRDPIDFPVSWNTDAKELWANDKGLLEVWGLPAGFMCLSRAMVERMVRSYPNLEFYTKDTKAEKAYALFDPYRIGRIKFGEDYSFCRRWRDIGGKVWLDPEIKLGHIGFKTFVGTIGSWLKDRGAE